MKQTTEILTVLEKEEFMLRFNEKHATDYYFKNMVEFLNTMNLLHCVSTDGEMKYSWNKENGHGK